MIDGQQVTQQQIIEAIADSLALPIVDVDLDSSFQDDLGLNPIETADLLQSISRKFHIFFEPHETEGIRTVEDLVELVEDKLLE